MSFDATVSFTCSSAQIPAWNAILALMEQGMVGAKLQDEFDVFGEAAAHKLEDIMEKYGTLYFAITSYKKRANKYTVSFCGGVELDAFVIDFKELVGVCCSH